MDCEIGKTQSNRFCLGSKSTFSWKLIDESLANRDEDLKPKEKSDNLNSQKIVSSKPEKGMWIIKLGKLKNIDDILM